MKQYLYIALFCFAIAIWAATGIGCIYKYHFEPDCATKAANRALMAGELTRIAMGIAPLVINIFNKEEEEKWHEEI